MTSRSPAAADRIVYVAVVDEGLSRRRQVVSWLLAVALLALLGIGSTYAGAAPVLTGQRVPQAVVGTAPVLSALSTGCTTTHTGWDGTSYTTVELTLVGSRVASPGDRVTCAFAVTNTGPSDATMSLALRAAEPYTGPANPDLAEDVDLVWDVAGTDGALRFDQATVLGEHVVAEVQMSQGAVVPVLVGFAVPVGTTTGTRDGQDSTVLTLDVTVVLQGTAQRHVPAAPETAARPVSQVLASESWPLTLLGSTGAEGAVVAGVALALLLSGAVLWVVARRRRSRARRPSGPGSA